MIKIYSKIQPEFLLHLVFYYEDFKEGRTEIIEPDNFIQCAALEYNQGETFRPHIHRLKGVDFSNYIAQESFVVIAGSVRCVFYDIDGRSLTDFELNQGDASFTLYGGHTYIILTNNTKVYEFKTGPYRGQDNDKTFINQVN